jgi:peptidylprolyl isomerase
MLAKYPTATQTESGLMYIIEQEGTGVHPKPNQEVEVHYTGWLTNGTKFDSSRDRNTTFKFPLGQGRVIKGWDEGIALCKIGGKIKLIIPHWLAYGSTARPSIPAESTLIFDVELFGAK